jgi:hypothetical protein
MAERERMRAYFNALNAADGAPTLLYVLTVDAEQRRDRKEEYDKMAAAWREHGVHFDENFTGLACRDRAAHPDKVVCMRMNHIRGDGCTKPGCRTYWRSRHVRGSPTACRTVY